MKMHVDDHAHSCAPGTKNDLAEQVAALAEELLKDSIERTTAAESAQMARVGQLIESPPAKALSMLMTDRMFRSSKASRTAKGWRSTLSQVGIGEGFGAWDRLQLHAGALGSKVLPGFVMAMETVEAELHGWSVAPHRCKHDTDACFRQMLEFACEPENAEVVRIGVTCCCMPRW